MSVISNSSSSSCACNGSTSLSVILQKQQNCMLQSCNYLLKNDEPSHPFNSLFHYFSLGNYMIPTFRKKRCMKQ